MQYQKDSVRKAVLESAEKEFKKNGYQEASIRDIAREAEVSVSNIYNYFSNKDELFCEVLRPILQKIRKGKEYLVRSDLGTSTVKINDFTEHQDMLLRMADFIEKNRELLQVLFFKSYGSSLENFKEDIFDWYVDFWGKYVGETGRQLEINEFIFRNIAGVWYNLLEEILKYDIKGIELKKLVKDTTIFAFGGWNSLVEWKRSGK